MFPKAILAVAVTLALQTASFADITIPTSSAAANAQTRLTAIQSHLSGHIENVHSGLEAHDDSPLGNRTPLVLVHGIGSYESDAFHWENFLNYADKKADFQGKYKLYLYHYDSTRSVPGISRDLQHTLKGFIGALGGRNIKILAYSEGGLLTRNALQDPYIDSHTEQVLTIATPFHGSPLANPQWIQQQVKTENAFNVVRIGQKIAYKITGRKYPTFRQDFHWDNFDGAIPMEQYVKDNGPVVHTNYTLAKKNHFVTYGSYFGTEVDPSVIQKELGLQAALPKEKPQLVNVFRKNFLFSLIRNNIGRLPLANHIKPASNPTDTASANPVAPLEAALKMAVPTPAIVTASQSLAVVLRAEKNQPALPSPEKLIDNVKPAIFEPVSMMMFNDGISPISSTLWLGRFTQTSNGSAIPVEKLWSTLKSLKGSGQARLFSGLDHRNWMDGTTRTGQDQIQDLLNPNEPPRSVFEWIVYDLMS